MNIAQRAAVIETLIPRPPVDVAPLRNAISNMVANQWAMYLPSVTARAPPGASHAQSVKARFIAEMYARVPGWGWGELSRFEESEWNREQRWMADTSLLMLEAMRPALN